MVKELIDKAVQRRRQLLRGTADLSILPASPLGQGVPTLKSGVYRPLTPQLTERYEIFGRWENATHGHWLGLNDMTALWKKPIIDKFLEQIEIIRRGTQEGWPNHVSALFREERLSLFAGSDQDNEAIYLLWLDDENEPELSAYDSNGESRYKDLATYLNAYIVGDISAWRRSWRA